MVYTAADIDVAGFAGADITTGTVPQIGSSAVPLTGNINVSGLTDGQFYVVAGAFAQAVTINLTMTGPGQTPLTASHVIGSPGGNNRLHSVEFSFSNPGGNYYNIEYSVNHGPTLGRRRAGGVLLDGTIFVDTVEPEWVATWPNASPVSSTLFTLNGNTNEDSIAYYVVLPDGASAPTSAQVKAGTDASDSPALFSGDFAMDALVPGSEMITGLTASTAYDVYVVAEDVRGPNLQATPVLVDVTTNPPDITPPGWTATYPQQSRTPAGLTGIANIDEPGTAYFVVLSSGATAPTSAQVKAGTDASDAAAPSGNMSLLVPGVDGTDVVAGLTIGATYDVWFVAEDLEGNLQATPISVASAPTAPVDQFVTGVFAWGTSSVWSATTGGSYTDPWGSGNNAVFEGGAGAVAIASGTVVNDITFNSNNWTLQGGPLTLAGTTQPVINVNGNTPRLENSLAGTQGFTKTGTGVLRMVGTNSITGGIVIDGGWLGDNLGPAGTAALNNNDITANAGAVGITMGGGTTTNGGITINDTTLSISNNNSSITVNGPVIGNGGIALSKTGNGFNGLNLLSTSNTFTGGVNYTSNVAIELNVNSFADTASLGAGNIRFGLGNPSGTTRNRFALQSGATSPLTLTNRQFEITSANNYLAQIYNNSAQAFTINSDLIVSGTGTKTLELGGTSAGTSTFAGAIGDGSGTLVLNKTGASTWVLSGDNTYTGTTTVTGGTLGIVGGSQASAITVNNGTFIEFTLGSPTTSTAALTLGATATIRLNGTPDGTSNYLLMTASSITGTPVLVSEVTGYTIEVQAGNTLALIADAPPLPTTTLVIDLGAGTVIEGGEFIGSGPTNLPVPTLPAGSILRSIALDNVTLTATNNGSDGNFTSDLAVLLDPTPGTPGGDFSLGITSSGANQNFGGLGQTLVWSGGNGGVGTPLTETKTDADWATTGDIDLANTGLFLGNAFRGTGWVSPQGGTWSGTITLTYDLVSSGSPYQTWADINAPTGNPDEDFDGDGVSNAVEFVLGGDKDTNDLGKLPTVATTGTDMTFTFVRDQDSVDPNVSVIIEVGTDLAAWPDVFTVGADTASSTAGVTVTDNANGTDTITLTVAQAPDTKKFARLKVVIAP